MLISTGRCIAAQRTRTRPRGDQGDHEHRSAASNPGASRKKTFELMDAIAARRIPPRRLATGPRTGAHRLALMRSHHRGSTVRRMKGGGRSGLSVLRRRRRAPTTTFRAWHDPSLPGRPTPQAVRGTGGLGKPIWRTSQTRRVDVSRMVQVLAWHEAHHQAGISPTTCSVRATNGKVGAKALIIGGGIGGRPRRSPCAARHRRQIYETAPGCAPLARASGSNQRHAGARRLGLDESIRKAGGSSNASSA